MDGRIHLRSDALPCRIGVLEGENERPQPVRFEMRLDFDAGAVARSGALVDTVDYGELFSAARRVLLAGRWELLESLANALLSICLEDPRVRGAEVDVTKIHPPLGEGGGPVTLTLRREAKA
jgi:dihydroneopterin aldolase